MSSTNFSYGTLIQSSWLNDVNAAVYNTLPTLATKISPSFTTPNLGVATATSINKNNFTQPATSCTWTLADGKTLNISNTLTFSGTDGASLVLGAGANTFSGTSSGTNTGDQLTYKTVKVSGQPDVVAGSGVENLTLVAGTGVTITTDNTAKSVTVANAYLPSSLVLLGTAIVSTSVASIDFLNTFSSTYDAYMIEVEAILLSTATSINMVLAKAGVADTTANYFTMVGDGTASTSGGTSLTISGVVPTSGALTLSTTMKVLNANSASAQKVITSQGFSNSSPFIKAGSYYNTNIATGFRLYPLSGNFTSGTVRVYGIKNS